MESKNSQTTDEAATKDLAESNENFSSELREAQWSVVSFENCLAKNLTYEEAARKLKQFQAEKIAGLCIITDEAAERIVK